MIVSFKHNYIFVKTIKTAGTSVEIALSTHTSEDDIITALAPNDELKRLENPRARLPQNFCKEKAIEYGYREIIKSGNEQYIDSYQKEVLLDRRDFKNHEPIKLIRSKLDPDFFRNAFKFTVERHPYERIISRAYWHHRNRPDKSIDTLVNNILKNKSLNNTHFYTVDGKQAVDYFILYENLRESTDAVGEKIGAPDLWEQMPITKHEHRTDRRPAKELLTDEQKKRIVRQCRDEFEMFGYET